MKKLFTAAIVFAGILAAALAAPRPAACGEDVLAGLRPHPRLFVTHADVERVRELIASDPDARALYERTAAEAERILAGPMTDFTPTDYRKNIVKVPVMLGKFRELLRRVQVLLTVWRVGGDVRYLDRARAEVMAGAALDSWNPWHFLDVAEMTHAIALGYDWMYQELSDSDRRVLREAIVRNGLHHARKSYRYGWLTGYGFWNVNKHNWNQVCNGGITLGALAIADEEPKLARYIIEHSIESIRLPMGEFAPDGAWTEGPSYWDYATVYNIYMLAGLQSALGHDFGLSEMPGFSRTGDFRMHSIGPAMQYFNYADAHPPSSPSVQMFWLSRRFDQPVYAWHARMFLGRSGPMALWWYDPREPTGPPPLDARFRYAETAMFRSSWDTPLALYLAIKGGDNQANHSHLDLGTFVFDALGVRWANDLGSDSYKLPSYFDTTGPRWKYFRTTTQSHNTIVIDGRNQEYKARAEIIKYASAPERAVAVVDLTKAWGGRVSRAWRGFAMLDRARVIIQDEVEADEPVEIVWNFFTDAEIKIEGRTASLARDGKSLRVKIVEPGDAAFRVVSARRDPPENPNEGMNNLSVRLPDKVTAARIVVELEPYQDNPPPDTTVTVVPLAEW